MSKQDILTPQQVFLDDSCTTQDEVFTKIAQEAQKLGLLRKGSSIDTLVQSFKAREAEGTTGFGDGVAVPHARNEDIVKAGIFIVRFKKPVEWKAMDEQPVHKIKDLKTRFNIKTVLLEDYSELAEIFNSINSLVLRKNIFISGAASSYEEFDNEINSKTFLYHLANELCKKQKKIISCYGLRVSDLIISSAVDYSKDNGTDLEETLDVWPFPQQSKKT